MCCSPAGNVVGSPETQLDRRSLCRDLLLCAAWMLVMSQHGSFRATVTSTFRVTCAVELGDTLCPQLLSLSFDTFPLFAPAAESRVLHGGAVCEAPAEDPGPCSHHYVSEAQTSQPLLSPSVEGMKARKEPSTTPSSTLVIQAFSQLV